MPIIRDVKTSGRRNEKSTGIYPHTAEQQTWGKGWMSISTNFDKFQET